MSHRQAKAERQAERGYRILDHRGAAFPRAAATPPEAKGADSSTNNGGWAIGWGQGHQGADFSRLRGYVYFPELDTRREITSYTRTEMLRRGRFLYANHGIAKRIVNGLARMIAGTGLTAQANTGDKDWNRDAEKIFASDTESQFVFDVGGRYNFKSSQQAMLRFHKRDGDAAAILASTPAGRARLAFYEGHQIGNAGIIPRNFDQEQWSDGVRLDRNNCALGYRFPQDDGSIVDVAAQDMIFYCDYERGGQSRGLTVLAHAINNLLDVAEITGYIKTGVKLANQYGYWIETDKEAQGGGGSAGDRVKGSKTVVTTAAGDVTFERIYGAGQIPDLKPGQKLQFNKSEHPHPNNLSLMEFLIRDIAWGVGLSPELLWNIAALGGANTRFVMADAQGWIEEQQAMLVRLYCQRVWVYFIAKAMQSGRLRRCQDPEWWKCNWITPPRLTVDFGRDGRLHIEQLKAGLLTYTRALAWQGVDFRPHMDTWLDELAYFKAGMNAENAAAYRPGVDRNISWADVQNWRNLSGNSAAQEVASIGQITDAEIPETPAQASAFFAALAKKPEAAARFLAELRELPEAA